MTLLDYAERELIKYDLDSTEKEFMNYDLDRQIWRKFINCDLDE